MKELSQNDNLILQSCYTFSLLMSLSENKFLSSDYFMNMTHMDDITKAVISSIGIDNQGCLMMGFYALLVIPRQLLFEDYKTEFAKINCTIHSNKVYADSTYASDSDHIDYIRHIRNAIVHARVEFLPQQTVTFSDEDNAQSKCTITLPLIYMPELLNNIMASVHLKHIARLKATE